MNHGQMSVKRVDLWLPVCPVLSFGFPPAVPGKGGGFAGWQCAVEGCTPSFTSLCHCPRAYGVGFVDLGWKVTWEVAGAPVFATL